MQTFIRQATEQDQPVIRALVREAGINPLHLHWQNFVLAQDGDRLVGCGQLRPHADGSAELASIAVTPSYQGRGIGVALVKTLIHLHVGVLYLMCEGERQRFYARFGFVAVPARALPREMRLMFGVGSAFTWIARTLFRQPVGIAGMRRDSEDPHLNPRQR